MKSSKVFEVQIEKFEVFNWSIKSLQLKYLKYRSIITVIKVFILISWCLQQKYFKSSIEEFGISFHIYSHESLHLKQLMSSTEVFEVINRTILSLQLKYLKSSIEIFEVFNWRIRNIIPLLQSWKSSSELVYVFNRRIWSPQ